FIQLRPHAVFNDGERFVSPPPFAWLLVPLSVFGAGGATIAWLAISLAALVLAWFLAAPGAGWTRSLWLLGALAWYPVLYGLSLAQPALVIVALAAIAWRLAAAGQPYHAGVVLAPSLITPQPVML